MNTPQWIGCWWPSRCLALAPWTKHSIENENIGRFITLTSALDIQIGLLFQKANNTQIKLRIGLTYRFPVGYAATDSLRPRPNTASGTFDIVTTECRRPDGCGACDNVAKNSASFGLGPEPSPPRSDNRRTWLAVMPSVTCCDGSECFRVSRGSRHGDNRYGLLGESMSKLSRGVDFILAAANSSSSQLPDSSTTILKPSCWLNDGVNEERRNRLKCSVK